MTPACRIAAAAVSGFVLGLGPPSAHQAQGQTSSMRCAPREVLVRALHDRFGEDRLMMGLSGKTLVETWANLSTGTWTITMQLPDGLMCLLASGSSFDPSPLPRRLRDPD